MTVRLLKVKRKLADSPPPDFLILDGLPEQKRSRTDLDALESTAQKLNIFERVSDTSLVGSKPCPEAKIQPSLTNAFNSFALSKEPLSKEPLPQEDILVIPPDDARMISFNTTYDFYILKEDLELVSVDLSLIDRVVIPESELLLFDHSEEEGLGGDIYSDEDSNAESYYRNDYPDENSDEYERNNSEDDHDDFSECYAVDYYSDGPFTERMCPGYEFDNEHGDDDDNY